MDMWGRDSRRLAPLFFKVRAVRALGRIPIIFATLPSLALVWEQVADNSVKRPTQKSVDPSQDAFGNRLLRQEEHRIQETEEPNG